MTIKDLQFVPFISQSEIEDCVQNLADEIQEDYADKTPTFFVILNGAFMFASDLVKQYKGKCKISFMRLSSYRGHQVNGQCKKSN